MNPTQVQQDVNAARAQGQANQNLYNQQAAQQYGAYQNTQNQANQSYKNLSDYTAGLQSGQDLYNQQLQSAQDQYGFDPKQLLRANQALANTNTTMANLPQAVQQQGNYYGTTAGAEANNYANLAGNLQNVLAGQSNAANAFQSTLAATQNQANQAASLGLQSQQIKSQNYQSLYSNAVNQMQQSGTTLAALENLQQQQGKLTADQISAYQNAYSNYVSAQAQAQQAAAQARQINQQVDMVNRLSDTLSKIYGGDPQSYATALVQMMSGNANVKLPNAPSAPQDNSSSTLGQLTTGMGISGKPFNTLEGVTF